MRISRTLRWREGKCHIRQVYGTRIILIRAALLRWSQLFDKETDWNIVSVPGNGVNERQVKLSRGKYLGGCSGCNGTLCIRGSKQDFDDWNMEGWSGDEFFGYMRKVGVRAIYSSWYLEARCFDLDWNQQAETFHTKSWFKTDPELHGYDGPLHIEPHDLAPISDLIMRSMISKGMPLDHDMFTHGNNPHGCGHAPRTVYNGIRTTGADFITKGLLRDNVTVLVNTHVDKVLLERCSDGELRATGVRVVQPDGTREDITATKEVIVNGGSYCSPNILNRSGLGRKDDLERLGIEVLADLPGIGQNLMDHLIVFMFYETERKELTNDHLAYHDNAISSSYQQWKDSKSGFLSTFPFGIFAFARLDDRLADSAVWNSATRQPGRDPMGLTPHQPNVEFWNTECYGGPKQYDQFPTDHK
jgi:choline dehydrogenase-like flavoprotein